MAMSDAEHGGADPVHVVNPFYVVRDERSGSQLPEELAELH